MNRIKNLFIVFLYLLSFTTAYGREEKNDYELIWKEDFKGKSTVMPDFVFLRLKIQ